MHLDRFQGQGCQTVLLWVDEANIPANCLYSSAGFIKIDRGEDYYGPGRNVFKDGLQLTGG